MIPILDLKGQYKSIKPEIDEAIHRVLDRQDFILGEEVEKLEQEIASYCGVHYAVGVSSGTDALTIALMALGIGQGSEVITTPYSFFATSSSIARLGAKPVFVDIEPSSYNIDADKVESKITSRTKAILPVHFAGQTCDMDTLSDIALNYDIPIVEDCAQSIGARYYGRKAGSIGNIGCYSFYPSKNLGAYGDAGMVVTDNQELANKMRILRNHGQNPRDYHTMMSGNHRMDEIQAAVLRTKLKHLDEWIEKRREHARLYRKLFLDLGTNIILPKETQGSNHTYHLFLIRSDERYRIISRLQHRGIGFGIYYHTPLHSQPCFSYLGYKIGDFPNAERASLTNLALPIYPELTDDDITRVAEVVDKALK